MEDLLEKLMLEAKDAHMRFEVEHGPDDSWPRWYAQFILRRLNEEGVVLDDTKAKVMAVIKDKLCGPMGKIDFGVTSQRED